jgi:hypothetical protein
VGDLLRVLFVTLKNLQARPQKVLQFSIARIGNEHRLKRIVDRLVVGDFIVGVGFVERGAVQFLELGLLGVRLWEMISSLLHTIVA